MNRLHNEAVIVGGLGQSEAMMWGFANELTTGPHRVFDDAHIVTLAQAIEGHHLLEPDEALRRTAIGISAGVKCVEAAGIFVTVNGVEPTGYMRQMRAAVLQGEKPSANDGFVKPGISENDAVREIAAHMQSLRFAQKTAKKHSTFRQLVVGGTDKYPEGRLYLTADKDEFGFGRNVVEIKDAKKGVYAGVHHYELEGTHGEPLLRPRGYTAQFKQAYEESLGR